MTEEMITITKEKYGELVERCRFLDCLEAAGVDNWQGHEEAIDMYQEGIKW